MKSKNLNKEQVYIDWNIDNPKKIEPNEVDRILAELVEQAKKIIAKNKKLELVTFWGCDNSEHYGQFILKERGN